MLVTLSSNWKKHLFTILNKLKMKYAFAIMSDKIKQDTLGMKLLTTDSLF